MIPIAHRGFWFPNNQIQNSLLAISDALNNGWAVEIDVVMHGDGDFSLLHGTPTGYKGLSLHTVLSHIAPVFGNPVSVTPRLFINVKQPQVETELVALLKLHHVESMSCLFDYELVGDKGLGTRARRQSAAITILGRASDRQGESFENLAWDDIDGVWLDTFDTHWIVPEIIERIHDRGKQAFIVSPELHNRKLNLWLWHNWNFADGICTDFPHLHNALFNDKEWVGYPKVYPHDPWW